MAFYVYDAIIYLAAFSYFFIGYLIPIYCYGDHARSKKDAYRKSILFVLIISAIDTYYATTISGYSMERNPFIQFFMGLLYLLMGYSLYRLLSYHLRLPWKKYFWISFVAQNITALFSLPLYSYELSGVRYYQNRELPLPIELIEKMLFLLFLCYLCSFLFFYFFTKISNRFPKYADMIPDGFYNILYGIFGLLAFTSKMDVTHDLDRLIYSIYRWQSKAFVLIVLLFVCLTIIFIITVIRHKHQLECDYYLLKNQLHDQYEYYQSLNEQNIIIRKMYHDIGNHLATLDQLFQSGSKIEANEYLQSLSCHYNTIPRKQYSLNPVVDALLLQKTSICEKQQIACEVMVKFPVQHKIANLDLVSVFSNLIDNAIEACVRNKITSPYILVKTECVGDFLIVQVKNSNAPNRSNRHLSTWKKETFLHGFGLKILNDIANRYDGQFTCKQENDCFTATITLNYKNTAS